MKSSSYSSLSKTQPMPAWQSVRRESALNAFYLAAGSFLATLSVLLTVVVLKTCDGRAGGLRDATQGLPTTTLATGEHLLSFVCMLGRTVHKSCRAWCYCGTRPTRSYAMAMVWHRHTAQPVCTSPHRTPSVDVCRWQSSGTYTSRLQRSGTRCKRCVYCSSVCVGRYRVGNLALFADSV